MTTENAQVAIPGGFRGIFSPDGQSLGYGFGTVRVRTRLFDGTGDDRHICNGYLAGWTNDSIGAVSRDVEISPGNYGRSLTFVDVQTLQETPSGIDPYQQPGYNPQWAVQPGGVVMSSRPGQFYRDGRQIATEASANPIEDFKADAGGYSYLFKLIQDPVWPVIIRGTHDDIRIDLWLSNSRIDRIDGQPWVSANYNGSMYLRDPVDGREQQGPAGESRGALAACRGELVVITVLAVEDPSTGQAVPIWRVRKLAQWRDPQAKLITLTDVGFSNMDVRVDGDTLLYCGNLDTGTLTYGRVSLEPLFSDVPPPVYDPKADLVRIQAQLRATTAELDAVIAKL